MADHVESPAETLVSQLDPEAVASWVEGQRWYALQVTVDLRAGDRGVGGAGRPPPLLLALAQARFATGSHDLYQLLLAFLPTAQAGDHPAVTSTADWVAVDAVADPELVRELLRHIDAESTIETVDGCLRFSRPEQSGALVLDAPARPMGVEQSNSSIVFGDETVLKVFRRLEPGINPELEMLRFLTRRQFPNIAPLQGWYEFEGRSFSATLGVAQRFFADAVGGWELALEQIRTDPARVPDRARHARHGDRGAAQRAGL